MNLTWLDLSFNNISEITGLSGLTKLTDLSLYHNRITRIDSSLESCVNLHVLSLGRNQISDLAEIHHLRKLPRLRCLNLEGNLICKAENYTSYVLAFLSKLRYLDYQLIDAKKIQAAQESVQPEELTEIKKEEANEMMEQELEKKRQQTMKELTEDFCEFLHEIQNKFFSDALVPLPVSLLKDFPLLKDTFLEKLDWLAANLR